MPGPLWKEKVSTMSKNLDRCQDYVSKLKSDGSVELFNDEIYKDGNTVVEVNIKKTKKKSSSEVNIEPKIPLNSKPKRVKATTPMTTWHNQLKWNSKDKPKKVSDNVNSNKKTGPVLQSRTFGILVKELRSALECDQSSQKVNNIMEDLEFIVENIKDPDSDQSQTLKDAEKARKIKSLTRSLKEKDTLVSEQVKQIDDLKAGLTKMTNSNNEMVMLLSRNLGLDEELKNLKEEKMQLQTLLDKKDILVAKLNFDLKSKVAEIEMLRQTISNSSAKQGTKLYSKKPATISKGEQNESLLMVSASPSEEGDSAIEDGGSSYPSSRSQPAPSYPQSQEIWEKGDKLIKNTKLLSGKNDQKLQTGPEVSEQPRQPATAGNDEFHVQEFLDRVKSLGLDLTNPNSRLLREYDSHSNITKATRSTSDLDTSLSTLTESKFIEGLQSSIVLHTDE